MIGLAWACTSFCWFYSSRVISQTLYLLVLLISFANSWDPDKDRRNVGPDLDPTRLTLLIVYLKEFFEKKLADYNKNMKDFFEKKVSRLQQKHEKITQHAKS